MHVDNVRDKNNTVKKLELAFGSDPDFLEIADTVYLSKSFTGWVTLRKGLRKGSSGGGGGGGGEGEAGSVAGEEARGGEGGGFTGQWCSST